MKNRSSTSSARCARSCGDAYAAHPPAGRVLMTPEQIAQRVEQLADALVDRYDGRRVVVLTVLAGAIVFLANLIRRLPMPLEADLVGFDVPDAFVVGYGLDFNGLHRNLPDIRVLSVHDEGSLA